MSIQIGISTRSTWSSRASSTALHSLMGGFRSFERRGTDNQTFSSQLVLGCPQFTFPRLTLHSSLLQRFCSSPRPSRRNYRHCWHDMLPLHGCVAPVKFSASGIHACFLSVQEDLDQKLSSEVMDGYLWEKVARLHLHALDAALTILPSNMQMFLQVSTLKALSRVDFAIRDSGACVFALPRGFLQPPA